MFVDKGLFRPTKKKKEEIETDLEQASSLFSFPVQEHTQAEAGHCCVCGPVQWRIHTPEHFCKKKTPLNIVTSSKVTSSEQESAVHLPLKNKGHSFQVSNHPQPETEDI